MKQALEQCRCRDIGARNVYWPLCCLLLSLAAVGCSATSLDPTAMGIVKDVDAIEPMQFEQICVEVNTQVKASLTDGLFRAVNNLGILARSKQSAFADECGYWMRYQATWGGFPEHLTTARIEVLDNGGVIGAIRYDATQAGSRPDRYGSAISKLEPLVQTLFVRVRPHAASASTAEPD